MPTLHKIGSGFIHGTGDSGIQPIPSGFVVGGPQASFILDDYPNASFAYSFRKLRSDYSGSAVRIRENGGDTETDIGFDAGGNFDTAAAASHIGANTGFIVTWYDQSGNGIDVTNSTASLQPEYEASGLSSLPTARFDSDYLENTSVAHSAVVGASGTTFVVMEEFSGSGDGTVFEWYEPGNIANNRYLTHASLGNNDIFYDFGSVGGGRISNARPSGWIGSAHVLELYRDSSDTQEILVDGTSLVSATRTAVLSSATGTLYVGAADGPSGYHLGRTSELITWGTDLGSTDRGNARTNINDYYSVF